jgi:hypothetical protein
MDMSIVVPFAAFVALIVYGLMSTFRKTRKVQTKAEWERAKW